MIKSESSSVPDSFVFDIAIVAVGYEERCRWVSKTYDIVASSKFGLEFGFLQEGSYEKNRAYFVDSGWKILPFVDEDTFTSITAEISSFLKDAAVVSIFVDISSMSREMMAKVALAIHRGRGEGLVNLTVAYAPSEYAGAYKAAPIRLAAPVIPDLAGWSSRPDRPLGVIMGLGCEPGLALGALQVLEPNKAWLYAPRGVDEQFDNDLEQANRHVSDIFDVTRFDYEIFDPAITRGRIEALLNSVDQSFRIVAIPFGPKLFAWLILTTVIFSGRSNIGVWSFSSKEHALVSDRPTSGTAVWYSADLISEY